MSNETDIWMKITRLHEDCGGFYGAIDHTIMLSSPGQMRLRCDKCGKEENFYMQDYRFKTVNELR